MTTLLVIACIAIPLAFFIRDEIQTHHRWRCWAKSVAENEERIRLRHQPNNERN